jgi:hypothetical protein
LYGNGCGADCSLPNTFISLKKNLFVCFLETGMRALNFVLENPRVDRTLLFNVKVIRIDRPDGKGGFKRGL